MSPDPVDYHKVYRGKAPSPGEVRLLTENPMRQSFEYLGWDIMFSGWRQMAHSFEEVASWVATPPAGGDFHYTAGSPGGMVVATTLGGVRYYHDRMSELDTAAPGVGRRVTAWTGPAEKTVVARETLDALLAYIDAAQPRQRAE